MLKSDPKTKRLVLLAAILFAAVGSPRVIAAPPNERIETLTQRDFKPGARSVRKIVHVDVEKSSGFMPAGRFVHTQEALKKLWNELGQPEATLPTVDFKTHLVALDDCNAGNAGAEAHCEIDNMGRMWFYVVRTTRDVRPNVLHRVTLYEVPREYVSSFNDTPLHAGRKRAKARVAEAIVSVNVKRPGGHQLAGHGVHTPDGLKKLWADLGQPEATLPEVDFRTHLVALNECNAADPNSVMPSYRIDDDGRLTFAPMSTQIGFKPGPLNRVTLYRIGRAGVTSFNGQKIEAVKAVLFEFETRGPWAGHTGLVVYNDFTCSARTPVQRRSFALTREQRDKLSVLLRVFGKVRYHRDYSQEADDAGRVSITLNGTGKQTTLAKPPLPKIDGQIAEIHALADQIIHGGLKDAGDKP